MKTRFRMTLTPTLLAAAFGLMTGQANADLTVGVIQPVTGAAAGLGIPAKNALALWPETIAGEKVKLIVLDDGSDPTQASKAARKLIGEDHVDVIVGSTGTPAAIAVSDIAAETHTVQLATAPMEVPEGRGGWTFRLPQSTGVMAAGIIDHMKRNGIKSLGFIGYSDAYGESWLKDTTRLAAEAGLKITDVERYARADTSVTGQALKLVASNPDAIIVVASGSGAAMPELALIERGFPAGKIYQTHSAASRDLIRVGGKEVEGTLVIAGLAVMPEGLPDGHPSKKMAVSFVESYEKMYGAGTRNQFAAHAFDAQLVLQKVVPIALKKGKPGTPEFREALKDALENYGDIVITQGTIHFTAKDHFGLGDNSRMMLTIKDGNWKVVER
jgi:branched-chain amino acid transport system substrate-binding protein